MRQIRNLMRTGVVATVMAAVAGCGGLSDLSLKPTSGALFAESDALSFGGGQNALTLRPVTGEDLVGPDGQCALPDGVAGASAQATDGSASAADPNAPPAAQISPLKGGIALQMTECDVVFRAGPVEKIDIGANERNERAVTLTYLRGPWPGIYRFSDGRLAQIDRVAVPEAPKAKKKAPARKRT